MPEKLVVAKSSLVTSDSSKAAGLLLMSLFDELDFFNGNNFVIFATSIAAF